MSRRRCKSCELFNGRHDPDCPEKKAAQETTKQFDEKLAKQGWSRVNSVDDLLPDKHPLKGKPKPESEKFWQAAMNGETFGGVRPRGVPELDHPFKPEESPKEKYTHLCDPETNRTLCGIDMLSSWVQDEGGAWREGTPGEFSAKPCPDCIRKKMESEDGDEIRSNQIFSD